MNQQEQDRIARLLKEAVPPVENEAGPARDLWPVVLRRLDERPAAPWFDWALAGGVVAMVALFPAAIPVLLYYL